MNPVGVLLCGLFAVALADKPHVLPVIPAPHPPHPHALPAGPYKPLPYPPPPPPAPYAPIPHPAPLPYKAAPVPHPAPYKPHPHPAPYKEEPARPYAFEYGVVDEYSGANFNAHETADGKVVSGSYQVHLPDGRIQTVTYTADHYNGFLGLYSG